MLRIAALLLTLLCWLAGIGPARAADDPDGGTDPSLLIERQRLHYAVEPDGGYLLTVEDVRTVLQPQAVHANRTYTIRYDRAVEDVVSVDAFTRKPDGRRVAAQAADDTARSDDTPADLYLPGDPRRKLLAFVEADTGDRLVVRYAIRARPRFAGHFAQLVTVPFYRARDVQVVFDLPAAMPLHADAAGFVPVQGASPPGRRRYQWRYVDGPNARIEAGAVSRLDEGKRLAVSTFADYPSFALAVRRAIADVEPSAETAALARQLTAGLPDVHTRALALTAWVGQHGHAQRALLLAAMLKAAGIGSTPALVNKGNAYKLLDTPTPALFNHMLTYVPALDLYLDPDAGRATGTLPADVLGKPVLLLDTGTFAMTPLLQPHKTVAAGTVDIGHDARSAVQTAIGGMTRERTRRQAWVCPAIDAADETTFRLQRGMRVVALPPPLQLMNGGIAYSASHTRRDSADGTTILVRRRLTFRHGRPTCSPADYDAMQPVLARIIRDLRARIVTAAGPGETQTPQPPGAALASTLRQPRARSAATASSVSSKRRSIRSRPER